MKDDEDMYRAVVEGIFQPFCCSGTFGKCLRCSWNPMQRSKCLYCYNRVELWLRISSQAISVCFGGTLIATRRTMRFSGTPVEKHCPTENVQTIVNLVNRLVLSKQGCLACLHGKTTNCSFKVYPANVSQC